MKTADEMFKELGFEVKHNTDSRLILEGGEHVDFNDLYEHEHDAIHASKYVNMERVEKLSLPFWSEIERGYLGNGLRKRDLFYREIINKSGAFAVYVNLSGRYIEIIKLGNSGSPSNEVIFDKPLTQENYAEACEIVKKIWENK